MSGPYVVTGDSRSPGEPPVPHVRQTGVEAVSKALELMQEGLKNVRIVDAEGNVYSSPNFEQLVAAERR